MDIFYQITEGIRITARPSYLADQSDPWQRRYVFTYRIRLENVGTRRRSSSGATGTSTTP